MKMHQIENGNDIIIANINESVCKMFFVIQGSINDLNGLNKKYLQI